MKSISIPYGIQVNLYEEDFLQGNMVTLTGPFFGDRNMQNHCYDLADESIDFADTTSSMTVK